MRMPPKPKPYMNEAWLRLHYITNGETIDEIARSCGTSTNTIRTQLKKHGFIR